MESGRVSPLHNKALRAGDGPVVPCVGDWLWCDLAVSRRMTHWATLWGSSRRSRRRPRVSPRTYWRPELATHCLHGVRFDVCFRSETHVGGRGLYPVNTVPGRRAVDHWTGSKFASNGFGVDACAVMTGMPLLVSDGSLVSHKLGSRREVPVMYHRRFIRIRLLLCG